MATQGQPKTTTAQAAAATADPTTAAATKSAAATAASDEKQRKQADCIGTYESSLECTLKHTACEGPFQSGSRQPVHCRYKQDRCEAPYDKLKMCSETLENCKGKFEKTEECKTHKKNCTGPYADDTSCDVVSQYRRVNTFTRSGGLLFVIALIVLLVIMFVLASFFKIYSNNSNETYWLYIIRTIKEFGRNNENLDKIIQYIIISSLYITLVVALIIIIFAAYDIKWSYDLGGNFEKQCNGIFIEKERADFHVYSCYNAINEYEYDTEKGIYSNKRGAIKDRFKRAYMLLAHIVTTILVIVMAHTFAKFIYVVGNTNRYINKWLLTWYIVALVMCLVILLSLWIEGNKQESSLNPYSDIVYQVAKDAYYKNDNIKNIVRNHYTYLVLIFVVIMLSLFGINLELELQFQKINITIKKISSRIGLLIVVLFLILLIIIPLFIKSAQAFHLNISTNYERNVQDINNAILQYKNTKNWDSLRKELEKNITLDERSKATPDTILPSKIDLLDLTTFTQYEKKLYMYLPHILDNNHINGVSIPQELKSIIDTKYLAGELSIELKEEFIKCYYRHKDGNDTISRESLGINGTDKNLLPYLKNDVRIDIYDGRGDTAINLLNKHILLNDNFKKGNPLPGEIIRKLEVIRKESMIKKTVENYFSKINLVTSLILIFIMYYIYHNLIYPNDLDIKIQYVSLLLFIIILILGIVGWWMKEMWL